MAIMGFLWRWSKPLLAFNAVLVLYLIISSKIKPEASNISDKFPMREDVGHHSVRFFPHTRRTLTNEETTSLSYAEKRFKLYDGVETFVMFIGYPRSSHSLVGALLDAHPEIIIPHEYDLIRNWEKYNRTSTVIKKNRPKYELFFDLHHLSTKQAMFLSRSTNPASGDEYNYNIPGLWQGGYETRIKVIGDKKGGATSRDLYLSSDGLSILEEISQVVQVPLKFIHVHRNPFDNIATIMLRAIGSRDAVREERVKINNETKLDSAINYYSVLAAANQRVREKYGDAVLDIPGHETVLRPKETLQRLCDHLGVTCSEDYLRRCSKVLYGTPSVTRNTVVWTEEQKERVTRITKKYPFLRDYSFDKYPSLAK